MTNLLFDFVMLTVFITAYALRITYACSAYSAVYADYKAGYFIFRFVNFTDLKTSNDFGIVAEAYFEERINSTGWSSLTVRTEEKYHDYIQAYWAGFVETNLTYELTRAHYINTVRDLCSTPLSEDCQTLKKYLSDNLNYVIGQSILHKQDPYWHQIYLLLWQIKGISDAFKGKFVPVSYSLSNYYLRGLMDDVLGIYLLQLNGDLGDLITALSLKSLTTRLNKLGHLMIARPSCSALIKVVRDDVYLSHVTWSPYNMMLRVLKHYDFPWHNTNNGSLIPGQMITFSSYPSFISSIDDFYIISSGLVVMETTHSVHNKSLWDIVRSGSQNSVFTFFRSMVANRLSTKGADWPTYFRTLNSGTYNNEWMIFDANVWNSAGSLIIAEQLPGIVMSADKTDVLLDQSYWASYNLPYFEHIYNRSGTREEFNKHGSWYSYNGTARAEIFRRDHANVTNFSLMHQLMRYNDFKHDPLSRCDCVPPYTGENAISARSDLNDPHGKYALPAFEYRLHGGTDAKLVNLTLIRSMNMLATSGPTYNNVPPFKWSDVVDSTVKKPLLHPELFNFTPVVTNFVNSKFGMKALSLKPLF